MAPRKRTAIERFTEKVEKADDGCWNWTAYAGSNGYGRFWIDDKGALAHRWSYAFHVGPIPDGLVIDHLCRNKRCVNPEHLEPVTASENVRRGIGPQVRSERCAAITHCPNGHEYTEENTYRGSSGRACLTCKKTRAREGYERNRELTIKRAAEWRKNNLERSRELTREAQRRFRARKKGQAA